MHNENKRFVVGSMKKIALQDEGGHHFSFCIIDTKDEKDGSRKPLITKHLSYAAVAKDLYQRTDTSSRNDFTFALPADLKGKHGLMEFETGEKRMFKFFYDAIKEEWDSLPEKQAMNMKALSSLPQGDSDEHPEEIRALAA